MIFASSNLPSNARLIPYTPFNSAYTLNGPAVSEFMSQKLESITLHGILRPGWGNEGSP
jgi:hypothetical protein